jgi:hypothetical protein
MGPREGIKRDGPGLGASMGIIRKGSAMGTLIGFSAGTIVYETIPHISMVLFHHQSKKKRCLIKASRVYPSNGIQGDILD